MPDLDPNVGAAAPATSTAAPASAPAAPAAPEAPKNDAPAALMPATNPDQALDDELSSVWESAHDEDDGGADDGGQPLRDPSGRFQARNPQPTGDKTQDLQPDGGEGETAEPSIAPPQSWSGEAKAKWNEAPPELQKYIAEREAAAHRAITQAGHKLKTYEPFDQLIRENEAHFREAGVKPEQSFGMLLEAQKLIQRDPVGGLVQIGLSVGIDLRPLLGSSGLEEAGSTDPVVSALQNRLQQLESKLTEQEQAEQQRLDQAQEHERQQTVSTVETWGAEKDPSGQPLRPYFSEVRPMMAALIRSHQAEGLEDAYDMAVHASPKIRARILQDQQAPARETRAQKVDKARRAAALNVRSAPATATPKTLDDELEEIASRHYR